MNNLDEIKDMLNDYRNSIKNNLDDKELSIVDQYIDKTINDLSPIFSIMENLKINQDILVELKQNLDDYMRENKWLEKHSKTS